MRFNFGFFKKLFQKRKPKTNPKEMTFASLEDYLAYKRSKGLDAEMRRAPTQSKKEPIKPQNPNSTIGTILQKRPPAQTKPQPKNVKPGF